MATHSVRPLASYREEVTELIEAGEPFGDVEEAIDRFDGPTTDAKAALWLLAFSLRDRDEQHRDVRAQLAALH